MGIKAKAYGVPNAAEGPLGTLIKASRKPADTVNAIEEFAKHSAGQIIAYPYGIDLATIAMLYDQDPTHRACCNIKAHAVIANGYRIVRRDGTPKAPPPKMRDAVESLCPDGKLEDFIVRVQLDYEALGNGYIEVIRDNTGRVRNPKNLGAVVGLRHVPAYTVWRLSPGSSQGDYVQIVGSERVYFREFGSTQNTKLNELLHIKEHSPSNYWYGIPAIWAALRAVLANRSLVENMIDLLESKGVSRHLLLMDGAESFIDTSDEDTINQYVNQLLSESGRKFLIIGTPPDTKSQVVSLRENMSLRELEAFRASNRDEIARAHGVPLRLIQIVSNGHTGGATEAETEFDLFKRLILRPRQNMWERIFAQTLLASNAKWAQWKVELNEIDLVDFLRQEQANVAYIRSGVYTINEVRSRLGMDPVEEGDVPVIVSGGVPLRVADIGNVRTLNPQANNEGPLNNGNQGN